MRIREIQIRNTYQHRHLDVSVSGGLIGLTGPNGSGKSNLLACLGESYHGEFHQTKDRIPSRGTEGGSTMVVTELSNGEFFTTTREFPSGAATVTCGKEKITGASKVNAWILNKLQTEKGILQNLVFVRQREIDAILFSKPTEKERLAQNFFSLGGASVIESALSKALGSLNMDSLADRLPGYEADVISAQVQLSEAERAAASMVQSSALEDEVLKLDQQISNASSLNAAIQAMSILAPRRDALKTECGVRNEEYRKAHAEFSRFDRVFCLQEKARHEACVSLQEHRRSLNSLLKTLNLDLSNYGVRPHSGQELQEMEASVNKLSAEIASITSQIFSTRDMLSKMGTANKCYACGGDIDLSSRPQLEASVADLDVRLTPLKKEHGDLERRFKTASQAAWSWDLGLEGLNTSIRTTQLSLQNLPGDPGFDPNPGAYDEQIRSNDLQAKELTSMYANLSRALASLQQVEKDIETQQSQFQGRDLSSATPVDISQIQGLLAQLRSQIRESNATEERLRSAQSRLKNANQVVADARSAATSNAAVVEIRKTIETCRTVFHPSGAPKTLVTRSNRMLEASINRYLAMMGVDFTITAKEGLNFDANFPDGIARDTELSEGQKASLSWSFRLAGCETFSSSVGLMTMDEPTPALDKDVLRGFLAVMGVMKQLVDSHGMQFFIATHSPEVARECEQIIALG